MAKRETKSKYYVRPDGLHESIRMVNGIRKAFRGHTDREVDQKILEFNLEQELLKSGRPFQSCADDWWEEIEPTLAHTTTMSYKPAMLRAKEHFGQTRTGEITAKDIDLYIKTFAKTRARKTVATQLQVIRQILRKAELDGEIKYNPATAVSIPRGLAQRRRMAPSKEQIQKIKDSKDLPFGLYAFLIYQTGCRRGEALALKWSDIDRKNNVVHITKSLYHVGDKPQIKEPKTESGIRDVPLLDGLAKALPEKPKNGYIFSKDNGETPLGKIYIDRKLKQYREESGVTVTAHQIRHGYATALFEAGIDAKTAQVLLGHAQLSTTMDIYTHVCSDVLAEAAKKMNESF